MRIQQIHNSRQALEALSFEERRAYLADLRRKRVADYNATAAPCTDDYDCPLCLNRTWFMTDDEALRPCSCQAIRRSLASLRDLGLLGAAKRLTFDRFRTDAPWQKTLLERAQSFAVRETPGWLFIGGQSGCGKTHLCVAAAVTLLYQGHPLRYMRWMNDSVRLKALAMEPERDRIMRAFIDAPVLYIDDLFKSAPTAADLHIAFELLDARYCDEHKRTIISSERTLSDLLAIDEALAGRILERCGDDYLLNIPRDASRNMRVSAV